MPARLPLMSQRAMSTPLIALNSTGPFRQYELTYDDCQMSSISSGLRPIRNGLRYLSTATWTTCARWVNVAQPRPYSPGSLVDTLTTTSRIRFGAVRIAETSVIFSGGSPRLADAACASAASTAGGVVSDKGPHPSAVPAGSQRSRSRRFMVDRLRPVVAGL